MNGAHRAAGLDGIDRTFDTYADRYSCASALRAAIDEARRTAFASLGAGAGGRGAVLAHTLVVDHLLRRGYGFVARYAGADRDPGRLPVCIVATGSYGRGELCPHSDLEVVVVHRETDPAEHARVAVEALFPFLGDAGLVVKPRVRSLDELRGELHADLPTATALLEGRLVTGARDVWRSFRRDVCAPFLAAEGRTMIDRWVREVRTRHRRAEGGNMGKEPDLMASPGGLLDLHSLSWIDRAARATWPAAVGVDFPWGIGEAEERVRELLAAAEALLAVRSALHLESGKRDDRLDLGRWEAVAARLGAGTTTPLYPAEEFLRRTRRHGEVVRRAVERMVDVAERAAGPRGEVERAAVDAAFAREGDRLVPSRDDVFREEPARLVDAFRLAQERALVPSERLLHLARQDAPGLAPTLREEAVAWASLRAIFEAKEAAAPTLRALADAGVLSAIIPAFDAVVGLARREPVHAYTVDEHLLRGVGHADALAVDDGDVPDELRALARRVRHFASLRVALFIHDLGKAAGRGHARAGEELARPLLARLGFDAREAEDVVFLVREHQTMSRLSRRFDPGDTTALDEFARCVVTEQRLLLLYLLTVCDLRATSATAYSRWPAELLRELRRRTEARLESVARDPAADAARSEGGEEPNEELLHLTHMPPRYVDEVVDEEVVVHLELARQVSGGDVAALAWDEGATTRRLWIVAVDRPRLLADLCGALAVAGFDVEAADAYTRADGVAFDRFLLAPDASRGLDLEALRASVREVLAGEIEPAALLARRVPAAATTGAGDVVVRLETGTTPDRLVVTVEAGDRQGLLFDVARAVAALGLDVRRATIVTHGGRVEQTFHVRSAAEAGAVDAERLEALRRTLVEAAHGARREAGGGRREDR